ncbi:dihydrodipicolinate synthase family protein [Burkholderia stagnalis]|uniref:Dihydrodipicolinate synthase family protein n=1 Tax=Burkholderia stagnalis TaxID=1503054 RepID=A0A6L3MNQ5_9BURK|nr:dihydrodipicolinate synthase family protein [Burkholderia stagnalis]KAB0632919.1 dihydrodipicolinate synthase family protein [Burkholderia stagnalis]KVO50856.1 dihydrodipicolinate synthase family protein [Burkholderia stagnalis]KVO69047.1 dihydrodipicolinate synthase family protein [Burkholderia stagnalis]KVW60387.1 dihydrodipicolinate synthase family protein [Burkholderia stagnalis]KVW85266.1 dihydrodipicolinate synthase family protein [Burkholderia stagnalis]
MQIKLPTPDGALVDYRLTGTPLQAVKPAAPFNRIAYSAAHVVADPLRSGELGQACEIDWERTIEYRRYLLEQGLGIAEAMDTAQRGMGLSWESAKELIVRTLNETRDIPGALIASGCGTDHLPVGEARSCDDVIKAYLAQIESVQRAGGRIILMASRALARVATKAGDYIRVYREVLSACDKPVILHWLGEAFDPELAGYWGHADYESAAKVCHEVIASNVAKVEGIKISLLDDAKEIAFRRRLPASVKMYTGDDFNYPELIAGDEVGYSHALLGIFDAVAPAASQALAALAAGDMARYDHLLAPTVPLSRHIFRAPTQYYKTGVVLLAYLNGFQPHFFMLGGHHGMRPPIYLAEAFRLADQANLLRDPELATARMQGLMTTLGCVA